VFVVNEGANTLDNGQNVLDMYEPRKRFDCGTRGVMGVGLGYAITAAVGTGCPVVAIEGGSCLRLQRHGDRNQLSLQAADRRDPIQQRQRLSR
jgi:thiamine pyrophosphate-dependent acetolactate synthase large subunit-like protein